MTVLMAKVLIVDDLEDNRDVLGRCLVHMGCDVVAASSGPEALDLIEQCEPDIVLLDIMMPEMDGFAVIRKIRETMSCERLPIIAISARHDADVITKALNLGADDYITKPFEPTVVRARLEKRLLQARSAATLRRTNHDIEEKMEAKRLSAISDILTAENAALYGNRRFWCDE